MNKGTKCGGIWSLDDLRGRCYVDDVTGCWHWRMGMTENGTPNVSVRLPSGVCRNMFGRRAAVVLSTGQDLPPKHVAFAKSGCKSVDCCNPEHCVTGTMKQWGEWVRASGIFKTPAKRNAAISNAKRNRVLTEQQAEDIRRSAEGGRVLAKRYGVTPQVVSSIRTGLRYRPAGHSVFGQSRA